MKKYISILSSLLIIPIFLGINSIKTNAEENPTIYNSKIEGNIKAGPRDIHVEDIDLGELIIGSYLDVIELENFIKVNDKSGDGNGWELLVKSDMSKKTKDSLKFRLINGKLKVDITNMSETVAKGSLGNKDEFVDLDSMKKIIILLY